MKRVCPNYLQGGLTQAVNVVQLMSSNSLSFSDLVLYVHLSVRETTQKQKEQPALGGSARQSQGGGDNYLFGLSWFRRVAVCLFLSSSGVEPCLPSGFEEQKRRCWRLQAVFEWGVGVRSTEDALDAGMGTVPGIIWDLS